MLIGATALATEDAFSTKKKQNSQATSQVNDCGNDILPENVGCQNTDAQIQGDENNCTSNSLVADQIFPEERNDGEIQAFQIPGESEGGVMRNPSGPGDPFAPLPPC